MAANKENEQPKTATKKTTAAAEATVSPERIEQLKRMGYSGELHEVKYKSSSTGKDVVLNLDSVLRMVSYKSFLPSEDDIVNAINWCKTLQLDPFISECYFIKGDGDNGRQPMKRIISKDYYFKKADAQQNYDGIDAGIIVKGKDGKVSEIPGTFKLDDDILLGGWATVYRRDRQHPTVAKVSLTEYAAKTPKWAAQPATMIAKIAKVAALREAFPGVFSNMYIEEELEDDEKKIVGRRFAPPVAPTVAERPPQESAGVPAEERPAGGGQEQPTGTGTGAGQPAAVPAGPDEGKATGADGIVYNMPKPTNPEPGADAGEQGEQPKRPQIPGIKLPPVLKRAGEVKNNTES